MRDRIVDNSVACPFCGAPIYWTPTAAGANQPLEPAAEPGPPGNIVIQNTLTESKVAVGVSPGFGTHRDHRSTCGNREAWGRKEVDADA